MTLTAKFLRHDGETTTVEISGNDKDIDLLYFQLITYQPNLIEARIKDYYYNHRENKFAGTCAKKKCYCVSF